MSFDDIISNSWVVGIVSSIISGALVWFLTDLIFSKRKNKERSQKIIAANNEILYSIRLLIVEQQTPSKQIIEALIKATARKYQIKYEDIYSLSVLRDDLIKDILDNSFLPIDQKNLLCSKVEQIQKDDVIYNNIQKGVSYYIDRSDRVSYSYVSKLLALIAVSTTIAFSFSFANLKPLLVSGVSKSIESILYGVTVPVFIAIIATSLLQIKRMIENRKEDQTEKEDQAEIDKIQKWFYNDRK